MWLANVLRDMDTSLEKQPITYYLRTYRRYIIPTWIIPIYFLAWGSVCEFLKLKSDVRLILFFISVGVPFYGTFFWAHRARKNIPYWIYCVLTMIVPFLIFVALAMFLAILDGIVTTSSF